MPAVYDAAWWGWAGTREELRERMPDLDDHDIERIVTAVLNTVARDTTG